MRRLANDVYRFKVEGNPDLGAKRYIKHLDSNKYRAWHVPYTGQVIMKRLSQMDDSEYEDMVFDVLGRVRVAILIPHMRDKEIIQALAKKLNIMITYDPHTGYMEAAPWGKRTESVKRMKRHIGRMMNADRVMAARRVQEEIARGEW